MYKVTNTVGNSFEHATGKVGARQFGAGVNSIISGVGGGLGDGITGGKLQLLEQDFLMLIVSEICHSLLRTHLLWILTLFSWTWCRKSCPRSW